MRLAGALLEVERRSRAVSLLLVTEVGLLLVVMDDEVATSKLPRQVVISSSSSSSAVLAWHAILPPGQKLAY
jgi:tetraacyldisaccharide-1-P 4'-kinase